MRWHWTKDRRYRPMSMVQPPRTPASGTARLRRKRWTCPCRTSSRSTTPRWGGGGMTSWMTWLDVTESSFGSRNGGGHYIAGFWVFVPSTPGGGLSPLPERVGAWDEGPSWLPAIQPGTKTCSSGQATIRQRHIWSRGGVLAKFRVSKR